MDQKTNITGNTSPEIIERDIELTREKMSGTVGEIQERLSVGHFRETMKEKILNRLRDAGDRVKTAAYGFGQETQKRGYTVMDTSREAVVSNPAPITMIALGLGWLLYKRRSSSRRKTAGRTHETTGELKSGFRERSSRLAGRTKAAAAQFGISAGDRTENATSRLRQFAHDNPAGIVLWAFAIGSLIGFIIPASRKERGMMGQASESPSGKAKETGQRIKAA